MASLAEALGQEQVGALVGAGLTTDEAYQEIVNGRDDDERPSEEDPEIEAERRRVEAAQRAAERAASREERIQAKRAAKAAARALLAQGIDVNNPQPLPRPWETMEEALRTRRGVRPQEWRPTRGYASNRMGPVHTRSSESLDPGPHDVAVSRGRLYYKAGENWPALYNRCRNGDYAPLIARGYITREDADSSAGPMEAMAVAYANAHWTSDLKDAHDKGAGAGLPTWEDIRSVFLVMVGEYESPSLMPEGSTGRVIGSYSWGRSIQYHHSTKFYSSECRSATYERVADRVTVFPADSWEADYVMDYKPGKGSEIWTSDLKYLSERSVYAKWTPQHVVEARVRTARGTFSFNSESEYAGLAQMSVTAYDMLNGLERMGAVSMEDRKEQQGRYDRWYRGVPRMLRGALGVSDEDDLACAARSFGEAVVAGVRSYRRDLSDEPTWYYFVGRNGEVSPSQRVQQGWEKA